LSPSAATLLTRSWSSTPGSKIPTAARPPRTLPKDPLSATTALLLPRRTTNTHRTQHSQKTTTNPEPLNCILLKAHSLSNHSREIWSTINTLIPDIAFITE
ncbi:hypothetical protein NDU88_004839, partial [Pleurodeles waltl]